MTITHLVTTTLLFLSSAPDGDRRPPPPPQEAFDACDGLSVSEPCVFEAPHGLVEGACQSPPRMDALICVPSEPPRRGPPESETDR